MRSLPAFLTLRRLLCGVVALALTLPLCGAAHAQMRLDDGWRLHTACGMQQGGEAISNPHFSAGSWTPLTVPSTVVAAQVASGSFDRLFTAGHTDPYFGMNLRRIPGTTYPIGTFFANQEMAPDSPYACGWWYRRTLHTNPGRGRRVWLHFAGINYSAEIWVNGRRIADRDAVAGAYRTYDFDITDAVAGHAESALAVETFAPGAKDLGINWVDWNPCPADKDMGLWGAVSQETTGDVVIRSPLVRTRFTDDTLGTAELEISALVENAADHPVAATVEFLWDTSGQPQRLRVPVGLAAHESRAVTLDAQNHPELRVTRPAVWWAVGMGDHPLHPLTVTARVGGLVSNARQIRFGIREFTSELTPAGHRLFRINHKPILIRGAGWSPDMLLRDSPERMREQFALVNDMHLNTIRLEGKLESEQFFDLADEQGILVMAGWCCCDHWEHWKDWTPRDEQIAAASLRAQMLRLRHHASLLVWLNGSDGPPPEKIERMYLGIEQETLWPNPIVSSASATPTVPTGPSGVKMLGPYDYVVPSYWLRDTAHAGGAYGFNTETSPGPDIPSVTELKRFLPADRLWPQDEQWAFHTGGGKYKSLNVMNEAMDAIYGPTTDLESYVRVAGIMAYDSERAMFEGYGRRKYTATGVVQWMLNNAWPSLIWHLYDYYLQPGAGYYGTKKACEPLHIQYSYDDHSVAVVNSTAQQFEGLSGRAELYDLQMKKVDDQTFELASTADSAQTVLTLPDSALQASSVTFLRLELRDATHAVVSQNFYWLPAKQTEFDWAKTDYTHTPPASFEDLQALRALPNVVISAQALPSRQGEAARILLKNSSPTIAFELSLEGTRVSGAPYDTLLWSDNYISLMPGERRTLTARSIGSHPAGDPVEVRIRGWNVSERRVRITVPAAHRSPELASSAAE